MNIFFFTDTAKVSWAISIAGLIATSCDLVVQLLWHLFVEYFTLKS